MIAIIDYGAGNTRSVSFALNRLGAVFMITSNLEQIQKADKVILPGVGHADSAMKNLISSGLDKLIPQLQQPVLGICLGMQLMCRSTAEGEVDGLGIFDQRVQKFEGKDLIIPHTGWNDIFGLDKEMFTQVDEGSNVYFVHSYFIPTNKYTTATCNYGDSFSAAMRNKNFWACQFHPEKSGSIGEQIMKNFLEQ